MILLIPILVALSAVAQDQCKEKSSLCVLSPPIWSDSISIGLLPEQRQLQLRLLPQARTAWSLSGCKIVSNLNMKSSSPTATNGFTQRLANLAPPKAITCNSENLTITFQFDPFYVCPASGENITITPLASAFDNQVLPNPTLRNQASFLIRHSPDPINSQVSDWVEQLLLYTSTVTSILAGVSGHPSAALVIPRARTMFALSVCAFRRSYSVDWLQYWIQLPITSGPYQYYIGAALFNSLIVILAFGIHAVASIQWERRQRPATQWAIIKRLQVSCFPAFVLWVPCALLQSVVRSVIVVQWHSTQVSWKVIVALCYPFWICVLGVYAVIVTKCFSSKAGVSRGVMSPFDAFVLGRRGWETEWPKERGPDVAFEHEFRYFPSDPILYCRKFGPLFHWFIPSRQWYLLVELGLSITYGLLEAVRTDRGCLPIAGVALVINFVHLMTLLLCRPFIAPIDQLLMPTVAALSVGANVFHIVFFALDDETHSVNWAELFASLQIMLIYVSSILRTVPLIRLMLITLPLPLCMERKLEPYLVLIGRPIRQVKQDKLSETKEIAAEEVSMKSVERNAPNPLALLSLIAPQADLEDAKVLHEKGRERRKLFGKRGQPRMLRLRREGSDRELRTRSPSILSISSAHSASTVEL